MLAQSVGGSNKRAVVNVQRFSIMSIQTGNVQPGDLGRTLTHEHVSMDFTHFYRKPPQQISNQFDYQIKLNNIGYLRQYPYSSRYNLILNDADSKNAVIKDIQEYKTYGGGTIVENTTEGLCRDLELMKKASTDSGVNIIAGTGFYIADMQVASTLSASKEELYSHMLMELQDGCVEDLSVKAGFMGEIASVWPLKDFEKRAIAAAGEVQAQVGCGVSFHPHRSPEAPFEIIRVYLEAGGRADKAVMSHLDRTLLENEQLLEFAELGTYCQFDLFGVEVSYYQLNVETNMPSDSQRLDKIKLLIDEGYAKRITMSHDIHTKHRLTEFGGHGYSHILNNVLPRMAAKDIPQEIIDQISIKNPAEWLTIK